jgi:hypothetical protein
MLSAVLGRFENTERCVLFLVQLTFGLDAERGFCLPCCVGFSRFACFKACQRKSESPPLLMYATSLLFLSALRVDVEPRSL